MMNALLPVFACLSIHTAGYASGFSGRTVFHLGILMERI